MKNRLLRIIIFIVASGFFVNCSKYNIVQNSESVTLYNCSSTTTGTYICFDSLLTDSRCPKNAVCVWSGNAIIKVGFHENGNTHKFVMSLKGYPDFGYPSDTTVNGYRIVFTDLNPYPDTNIPSPPESEMKASFSIRN